MTTFNFYLTNIIIPSVVFNNVDEVYDKILPSAKETQQFLVNMVNKALNTANEEVQKPQKDSNLEIKLSIIKVTEFNNAVLIRMPNAEVADDNYLVAITTNKNNVQMFSFAKGNDDKNIISEIAYDYEKKAIKRRPICIMKENTPEAFAIQLADIFDKHLNRIMTEVEDDDEDDSEGCCCDECHTSNHVPEDNSEDCCCDECHTSNHVSEDDSEDCCCDECDSCNHVSEDDNASINDKE